MAAPPDKTLKDLSGKWTMNKTLSDDPDPLFQLQSLSWLVRTTISYATVTLHVNQYTSSPTAPAPPATTSAPTTAPPTDSPSQPQPQPQQEEGVTHIDIEQHLTAGLRGSPERRTLDWTWRDHSDAIFGNVRGRSRFVDPAVLAQEGGGGGAGAEIDIAWSDDETNFLTRDWDADALNNGRVFQSYVESTTAAAAGQRWVANQTWGFRAVENEPAAAGEGDGGEGQGGGKRRYVRHVLVRKGEQVAKAVLVYDWIGPLEDPPVGSGTGTGTGGGDEDDGLAYE